MIGHAPSESLQETPETPPSEPAPAAPAQPPSREIGGCTGPEPTRYGDWEKDGRCIDF